MSTIVGNLALHRTDESPPPFRPFNDEAQWGAHEHLLERFSLPEYDEQRQGLEPPRIGMSIGRTVLEFAMTMLAGLFGLAGLWLIAPFTLPALFLKRPVFTKRAVPIE